MRERFAARYFRKSVCFIAVIALSFAGCATIDTIARPEIQDVKARIGGLDFQGVNLVLDVDVSNPYPVALSAPRFRYNLDIEGENLLSGLLPSGIDLPARSTGTVTIPIRLEYLKLWDISRSVREKDVVDYTVAGALLFDVRGREIELPLSHAGDFPVLRVPTFSVVDFDPVEFSVTQAKIRATARISNPNIFALIFDNLGYELKIGSIDVGGLSAFTEGDVPAKGSERIVLEGTLSATRAIISLLMGAELGQPTLIPSGSIRTPYGAVKLPEPGAF